MRIINIIAIIVATNGGLTEWMLKSTPGYNNKRGGKGDSMKKIFGFSDIIDLSNLSPNTFISTEQWGTCHVCGKYDDLRYGSCFNCADWVVTDEKVAWDIRSPDKKWGVLSH